MLVILKTIEEVLKQPGGRSSAYKVIQYTAQLASLFIQRADRSQRLKTLGKIMSRSRYALRLGGFISPLNELLAGSTEDYYDLVTSLLDTVSEVLDNLVGLELLGLWEAGDPLSGHIERGSDVAWWLSCSITLVMNTAKLVALLRSRRTPRPALLRALVKGLTDVYMSFIWAFSVENHPRTVFQLAGLMTSSIQLYNGWLNAGITVQHMHFHK